MSENYTLWNGSEMRRTAVIGTNGGRCGGGRSKRAGAKAQLFYHKQVAS